MSQVTTVVCDGCGRKKAEVNGWWVLDLRSLESGIIAITRADRITTERGWLDYCGSVCLLKAVSELLSSISSGTVAPLDRQRTAGGKGQMS
jgi:hypothetical protein